MDGYEVKDEIKAGQAVYIDVAGRLTTCVYVPRALGIAVEPRSRIGRLAQRTRMTRWLYWRLTGRKI